MADRTVRLTVYKLSNDEVYKDFARIPTKYRKGRRGEFLEAGLVCSLSCVETRGKAYVILRNSGEEEPVIGIDLRTRQTLGVKPDETYEFKLSPAGFFGKIRWASSASDVRYSVPVDIALILGTISVLLGILALFKAH